MPKKPSPQRASTESAATPPAAPLKPRKGLFILACIVFAAWVGFLLVLYFTTVRGRIDPHDHHHDAAARVHSYERLI